MFNFIIWCKCSISIFFYYFALFIFIFLHKIALFFPVCCLCCLSWGSCVFLWYHQPAGVVMMSVISHMTFTFKRCIVQVTHVQRDEKLSLRWMQTPADNIHSPCFIYQCCCDNISWRAAAWLISSSQSYFDVDGLYTQVLAVESGNLDRKSEHYGHFCHIICHVTLKMVFCDVFVLINSEVSAFCSFFISVLLLAVVNYYSRHISWRQTQSLRWFKVNGGCNAPWNEGFRVSASSTAHRTEI